MKFSLSAFLSNRYKIFLAFVSLFGALLVWYAMSIQGPGVTPDSINYIAAARNLIFGLGVVNYSDSPLVWWPPFYPFLLAVVQLVFSLNTLTAAMLFNLVLFYFTIYTAGLLFFRYLNKFPLLAGFATLAVIFSISLIPIFVMVWSETLFILFVNLFLVLSDNYWQKRNISSLLLLSIIVSLSCLTRYIGIILVFAALIRILLLENFSWKKKFLHALIFLFISMLPLAIWLLRNYLLVGSLTGTRMLSPFSYTQNMKAVFAQIFSWYIPSWLMAAHYWLNLIVMIVAGLILLKIYLGQKQTHPLQKNTLHLWGFVLAYVLFLLATSRTSFWQLIDNRYLAPIYVPVTLLLFLGISRISVSLEKFVPPNWLKVMIPLIVAIWFVYPVSHNYPFIKTTHDDGRQFASVKWQKNDVIRYIQGHPESFANCAIYSNGADIIYLYTDLKVQQLPIKSTGFEPDVTLSSLARSWPKEKNLCLVDLNGIKRDYLFSFNELLQLTTIESSLNLKEGIIYFAVKK